MVTSSRWDVLVLGVGGMGAAALAHLAGRALRVIGIEQDDVPSTRGSSVGQTRIIRKAYFEDARYVPLLHRAYDLWRALEDESDETTPLYVRTGCLNLGPAEHPAIRGVRESVARHRLPHERLDADEVRRRFPAFEPVVGDIGIYEEDAGYLRVEACTRAHARVAEAKGAVLRTRTAVRELTLVADGVRATLDGGEVIEAKRMIVSAGPWLASTSMLGDLARDLPPLVVTRQAQLWFRPRNEALAQVPAMPAFIHFVGDHAYYGLPLAKPLPVGEAGVKVCRHHGGEVTTAETVDRAAREEDERDVRGYIGAHLPNAGGPLLHTQVCMYTSTPDQHFIVGPHPRWPQVIILGGFSGHGYKMASVMGEIAADLVERGESRLDISLFDPTRFGSIVA
jgi:sarcosine oxidase